MTFTAQSVLKPEFRTAVAVCVIRASGFSSSNYSLKKAISGNPYESKNKHVFWSPDLDRSKRHKYFAPRWNFLPSFVAQAQQEAKLSDPETSLAEMPEEANLAHLVRSEALFAEAEHLANLGSWEHDLETGVISGSENLCRMLGAEPRAATIPEHCFWKLVTPQDHETVRNTIDPATHRESYEYQARLVLPDGSNRTFLTRSKPIIDSSGRVVKRTGVTLDITERVESARALEESEGRYRDLVEHSCTLVCTHDLDGRLLSMNELPAKLLGYRPEDLICRRLPELLCPKVRGQFDEYMERIQRDGSAKGLMVLVTSSGERRIWEYQNTLCTTEVPIPIVRWIAHDITERKEAERNLRKSESLLAQAEELANMGSWELEIDTQALNWSAHYYRMLGLEPENGPVAYGRGIQMIHPDDQERALRDADQIRIHGLPFENVLRFIRSDGSVRVFHSRAIAVTDETGRVVRIRGMSQDVTDKENEEANLRKSEALLSQAEEMTNLGSWDFDIKAQTATLSKHLLQMYGMASQAEWTPDRYRASLHPQDREQAVQIVNRGIAACKPFEYVSRFIAPGGRVRVHFVRGLPVPGADGKAMHSIGVVQDITDKVQAEEDLRRLSQELMRARDHERRKMARDLHESVGQTLAALKMSLGRVREELDNDESRSGEFLRSATGLADDAIRQLRTISYLMHPPMLDELGLGPAIRWYARGFGERSGIKLKLEIPNDLARQTQEVETTIFRIVQEALTNVHRYSGTQTAEVRLAHENGHIKVEVRDDGCGIPFNGFSRRSRGLMGVGIQGMKERVKELKGAFEIDSVAGKGTTVRAILPSAPANPWESRAMPDGITQLDTRNSLQAKRASG